MKRQTKITLAVMGIIVSVGLWNVIEDPVPPKVHIRHQEIVLVPTNVIQLLDEAERTGQKAVRIECARCQQGFELSTGMHPNCWGANEYTLCSHCLQNTIPLPSPINSKEIMSQVQRIETP